jgi:hypothetical protein
MGTVRSFYRTQNDAVLAGGFMTHRENCEIELKNSVQARLVSAYLREAQIPHTIRSFHDTAYSGIFQVQNGWGFVEAPIQYKEEIQNIVDDLTG